MAAIGGITSYLLDGEVALVSALMMADLGWLPAPPAIPPHRAALEYKNGPLIVGADSTEGHCIKAMLSHLDGGQCYKLVSVLMSVDLGWPPAPHLTSSSCVAAAI